MGKGVRSLQETGKERAGTRIPKVVGREKMQEGFRVINK